MIEPPLTIAEASLQLGISERSLRRILRAPEMLAKMQAEYRQTRTGQRRSILIPDDLFLKIAEIVGQKSQINTGINTGETIAEIRLHYERLLSEKDARIAELTAALQHERTQSQRHAEAHAQAQKLIPSPPKAAPPTLLERVLKRRK